MYAKRGRSGDIFKSNVREPLTPIPSCSRRRALPPSIAVVFWALTRGVIESSCASSGTPKEHRILNQNVLLPSNMIGLESLLLKGPVKRRRYADNKRENTTSSGMDVLTSRTSTDQEESAIIKS